MEAHTSTAHEGTNNAVKHSSAAVKPQKSIDKVTQTLKLSADIQEKYIMLELLEVNKMMN